VSTELEKGDKVQMSFGPYVVHALVVEVNEHGAVIKLPTTAVLDTPKCQDVTALDGTVLAKAPHTWLGRAHWAGARVGGDR
jgi:hypothetical protein